MKKKYERIARRIARIWHCDQTDKAGLPYYLHLKRVAAMVNTPDEKTVAWLHDLLEDTEICITILQKKKIPHYIIEAVAIMTHNKNESYDTYIERVATNPLATKVKIADLKDNANLTRLSTITMKDVARTQKYLRALEFLLEN